MIQYEQYQSACVNGLSTGILKSQHVLVYEEKLTELLDRVVEKRLGETAVSAVLRATSDHTRQQNHTCIVDIIVA